MRLLLVVVVGRLLKGAKVLGIRYGVALKSWFPTLCMLFHGQ